MIFAMAVVIRMLSADGPDIQEVAGVLTYPGGQKKPGRFGRRRYFRSSKHGAYPLHMCLRDVFFLPPCLVNIEDLGPSYVVFFFYGLGNLPSGNVQPGSVVLFLLSSPFDVNSTSGDIFPFSTSSGVVVVSGLASSGGSVSTASGFFFALPSSLPRKPI